jgi:hypothetical protein
MGRYDRGWEPRRGYDRQGQGPGGRGYDRGVYGGAYEGYRGGYPERGGGGGRGGYARDYPSGPFLPPGAYRRHPELDREPGPRGGRWGYELDDAGDERDDREILAAVRRRLYEDLWLDVERIDAEVEDGIVTLTGEVGDFMEARYAWDDAWETEGVRGVVNHLTVRTDRPAAEPHGDVLPQSGKGTRTEDVSAAAGAEE